MGQTPRYVSAAEKSDFVMAIDKRMDKFFEHIWKRYPLVDVLQKSVSADGALLYNFVITTASRPHEQKRERVMNEWLQDHVPFPVEVGHRICSHTKAGASIVYSVAIHLPE